MPLVPTKVSGDAVRRILERALEGDEPVSAPLEHRRERAEAVRVERVGVDQQDLRASRGPNSSSELRSKNANLRSMYGT